MIERQTINDKDIWIKVDAQPAGRSNLNVIPTEYFIATYYTTDPENAGAEGEILKDEDGSPKLFESPVAAVTYARKKAENNV